MLKNNIAYLLLVAVFSSALFGCVKEVDCSESSALLPPPVPEAKFRVIDHQGRDLFAANTPNNVSFGKLVATQPCSGVPALTNHIEQIGAGGLESYALFFSGERQPVTGENKECFTINLSWDGQSQDVIEFVSRSEHHNCGVTYYLDEVKFNGVTAKKDEAGRYLLQK